MLSVIARRAERKGTGKDGIKANAKGLHENWSTNLERAIFLFRGSFSARFIRYSLKTGTTS
jgi:hypothetical protein